MLVYGECECFIHAIMALYTEAFTVVRTESGVNRVQVVLSGFSVRVLFCPGT